MADLEDGLKLLQQEMQNEEINIKVNAIHRMQTVICSIDNSAVTGELIPYLDSKFSFLLYIWHFFHNQPIIQNLTYFYALLK